MSLKIRPLEKRDEARWRQHWQAYNDFYKRTITEEVTATTLARFLDAGTQMFCAVAVSTSSTTTSSSGGANDDEEKSIVGFVTWFPHVSTSHVGPVVYLNDLFVDPEARLGGIGGRLIDHVYGHSREVLGAESVYWLTQYFNHRAQLLYVKKATRSDFVHYSKAL